MTLCLVCMAPLRAASVLMISVDGLKPEYVLEADARGLKIPYLRSLVREGVYAEGVIGVWPTVTYPSHTTLLTGVWPIEHGIWNNQEFDPRHLSGDSWYWYSSQILAPTLWQAAHAGGLSTASVGWPVSVDAPGVDTLIPEYWRVNRPTEDLHATDVNLIEALSRPVGLLASLESRLGPYIRGNDPSPPGDTIKTRFALEILRTRRPQFMTLHLSALDEEEHSHGPFSSEANAELEILDSYLSELFAAARLNDRESVAVVVSDHGFAPLSHRVNLWTPFIEAGLVNIAVDSRSRAWSVVSWKAQPWIAGGMAAIMLQQPGDASTLHAVRGLLQGFARDERNGVAMILEGDEARRRGGFPGAAFVVVMKPGYYTAADPTADAVAEVRGSAGGHGFSPQYKEMRSAFFMAGPGIAQHRNLGVIDMRQIAPTVANVLNVTLPSAKSTPLLVR
jgi:predicted AlkP superfamily pyrophosphatase or phosphodiesterase